MDPSTPPKGKKLRGVRLTQDALDAVENALIRWWEADGEKETYKTHKLTRERRAQKLELDVKTWDRICSKVSVDRNTILHVFSKLSLGWKEEYCVSDVEDPPQVPEQDFGSAPRYPPSSLVAKLRSSICEHDFVHTEQIIQ
jgi:hypothetical protein